MKVKELLEILQKCDPELEVGGSGHFGEFLEVIDVWVRDTFVEIDIKFAGEEPD